MHPPVPEDPPAAAWGYGPPPPPPPPPGYQPAPYSKPQLPAPPAHRNTGLIVGLAIASVVALAGVVAALLLALGGSEEPVQAEKAAALAPAQTVVTQVIRERSRSRSSGSSTRSRSRSSAPAVTPVTRSASRDRDTSVATVTDTQRRSAAENAVRRHWSLIESGQYSAAFALLASSATTASAGTWVQEHVEDDLSSADLSVSASLTSPTSARVDVLRLRTVANSGCFTWTGSYDVGKIGGVWKITKANLTRSGC
jgi:hypothetical protein